MSIHINTHTTNNNTNRIVMPMTTCNLSINAKKTVIIIMHTTIGTNINLAAKIGTDVSINVTVHTLFNTNGISNMNTNTNTGINVALQICTGTICRTLISIRTPISTSIPQIKRETHTHIQRNAYQSPILIFRRMLVVVKHLSYH